MKEINKESGKHFRTCIVSRKRYDPSLLLRFCLIKVNREVRFDCTRELKGRGVYVLAENLPLFFKRRYLNRSFKIELTKSDYDRLYKEVALCQENQERIT